MIVGGTNYYIESILWENLVNPEDHATEEFVQRCAPLSDTYEGSSESLHARLKEIDPDRADQVRPFSLRPWGTSGDGKGESSHPTPS